MSSLRIQRNKPLFCGRFQALRVSSVFQFDPIAIAAGPLRSKHPTEEEGNANKVCPKSKQSETIGPLAIWQHLSEVNRTTSCPLGQVRSHLAYITYPGGKWCQPACCVGIVEIRPVLQNLLEHLAVLSSVHYSPHASAVVSVIQSATVIH